MHSTVLIQNQQCFAMQKQRKVIHVSIINCTCVVLKLVVPTELAGAGTTVVFHGGVCYEVALGLV